MESPRDFNGSRPLRPNQRMQRTLRAGEAFPLADGSRRMSRPFLPLDKPRSWTVFVVSCLTGVVIGAVGFGAAFLELDFLRLAAMALFGVCWAIAAVSWVLFMVRFTNGDYRGIEARPWKDQIW